MNYTTNVGERGTTAAEQTHRLIASDKVEGTAVFDTSGKHLGRVHHLMIDKFSGRVAYVVASFGGFLGIGENWVPLPWRALVYEPRFAGYVIDIDRSKLEKAPNFAAHTAPDWGDRVFNEEIEQYWYPGV